MREFFKVELPAHRAYMLPIIRAMAPLAEAALDESSDGQRVFCRECGQSWAFYDVGAVEERHADGCRVQKVLKETLNPAPSDVPALVEKILALAADIMRKKGQPETHVLLDVVVVPEP